ncbi:AmmeMemoRadiSam system protein B [Methanothermococcus sp. SCGC AD-155-C09]|nr:AmmeMemoRadiSam system protein B [Methanothermococcus sp. SCGC AD-155-C09]
MTVRNPSVAGMFYPADPSELIEMIEYCYLHKLGPKVLPSKGIFKKPIGLICPHAGYIYSGPIAAHSYSALSNSIDGDITFIILGPNHTGLGSGVSTMKGIWKTPLGYVSTDDEFVEELWRECDILDLDESAHLREHSIEVQLPFLQHLSILNSINFKIVPISMMMQDYETAMDLGYMIGRVSMELGRKVVIIASTDFSHYEPQEMASKKDALAIKAILDMDERELYTTVINNNITMCGYGPTIAMIRAMKELGAKDSRLLAYATSGDITGDYSSVVGYGSLVIE